MINFLRPGHFKVVKSIGIYTILNFVNSLIPFLLLPILTTYLSTEEYGIIDLFTNMSFILMPLIGLNVRASVIRFYYDKDEINFQNFLHTIISFLLFFGVIVILLLVFLSGFDVSFETKGMPNYLITLSVLYALVSQVCEILLSIWRAENKPVNFGVFRIIKTSLDLGLSIVLIVIYNFGWEGRVYTMISVSLLFAIIAIIIIKRRNKEKPKFSKQYLEKAIKYSLPLVFHGLGGYIIAFSDRFVILHYLDLENLGLYGVAYQVGMIMSFVNNSFNQAWTPFLFSKLKERNSKTILKLHNFNYFYFLFLIALTIITYLFVPYIYKYLIGKSFEVDSMIVFWVLLGYAFNGMYKIIVNYLFYFKKTTNLALYTIAAAVINIVASMYLVPKIGILGAAISTTVAFFVLFALVYTYYIKNLKTKARN